MSEKVQHHALLVLQPGRGVWLCEQKRLQLLAEHTGADAADDDANPGFGHFEVHIEVGVGEWNQTKTLLLYSICLF